MNIKPVVVLIYLLSSLSAFSQISQSEFPSSQESFDREWVFGINGGMTFSKISFNPGIKQDMLMQYTGGLTVRYISEKNIGLQLELNYSLRGWKERTDPADSVRYANYSRSLGYLELPFMTHVYFNMGKYMRVFFLAGPQVGFYLNEKVINSELALASSELPAYYNTKVQRSFDYGIVGGMGLEFRSGIGSFVVDGRYFYGLSDIFNNRKVDYFQSSSNQILAVKAAYLFRM